MEPVTREIDRGAVLDPKDLRLPAVPKVVDIRVEPYVDNLGDSELRVWVILENSTTAEQRSIENEWTITKAIREALLASGERRYSYMRFLTRAQFLQEPEVRCVR